MLMPPGPPSTGDAPAEVHTGGTACSFESSRKSRLVVTQPTAVTRALDKAAFSVVASRLTQGLTSGDSRVDVAEMEQLLLSPA
jgi:DNA-binding FrmR family transcriptional regulator